MDLIPNSYYIHQVGFVLFATKSNHLFTRDYTPQTNISQPIIPNAIMGGKTN